MQLPAFMTKMLGFAEKAETHFDAADKLANATKQVDHLEAELSAANAQIDSLTGQVSVLEASKTEFEIKIKSLSDELTTAKAKANEVIASQGLPMDQVPPANPTTSATGATSDPIAELRAQLAKTTDPKEKVRISREIRDRLTPKSND